MNFAERTDYSKEKYVSKKAKHHSDQVYILVPTIRLIAQTIYRRNSETAAYLRYCIFIQNLEWLLILQFQPRHAVEYSILFFNHWWFKSVGV